MLGSGRQSEFARSVAMLPSRNTAWGMLEATPWLDFARELLANAVLPLAGGEEGAGHQQRPQRLPQRAQRRGRRRHSH